MERKGRWLEEGWWLLASLNHRVRSRSYARRGKESVLTRSLFNFHVMAEAGLELPVVQFARSSSPTAILSFSVSIVGSVFGASKGTMAIKSFRLKLFNPLLVLSGKKFYLIDYIKMSYSTRSKQATFPLIFSKSSSITSCKEYRRVIEGGLDFYWRRGRRSSSFPREKLPRHENGTHVGRHVRRITGEARFSNGGGGEEEDLSQPSVGKFLILGRVELGQTNSPTTSILALLICAWYEGFPPITSHLYIPVIFLDTSTSVTSCEFDLEICETNEIGKSRSHFFFF